MGKFLCWLGLHSTVFDQVYTYSEDKRLVLEVECTNKCTRCGEVTYHSHWIWDDVHGMVDKPE